MFFFVFNVFYTFRFKFVNIKNNINIMMLQCAKAIGAGLSTIALLGVGIGIGNVFSSLMASYSRNPSLQGQLFSYAMLGFAITEAVGLFALLITFLILFT